MELHLEEEGRACPQATSPLNEIGRACPQAALLLPAESEAEEVTYPDQTYEEVALEVPELQIEDYSRFAIKATTVGNILSNFEPYLTLKT
jgi:hypothetical protein